MRVHLRFLRDADVGREALKRSGWLVECDVDNSVWAMHPKVMDEPAARLHLHNVGLLTACSVSIEFIKRATGALDCEHGKQAMEILRAGAHRRRTR
jgi:hypothetical protein